MNNNAIGVFDSGLGGLTCLKELNKLIPNENVIYFGDTARLPYGTRSRETILEYARQDIAFVKKQNVKMIIAASTDGYFLMLRLEPSVETVPSLTGVASTKGIPK